MGTSFAPRLGKGWQKVLGGETGQAPPHACCPLVGGGGGRWSAPATSDQLRGSRGRCKAPEGLRRPQKASEMQGLRRAQRCKAPRLDVGLPPPYMQKAGDSWDISPQFFLDFPQNFRLRTRNQYCTQAIA